MTQGKVDPLHKSGVERAGEPECLEALGEVREVAPAHAAFDPSFHSGQALSESAAATGFLDLAIEQVEGDLPAEFARSHIGDPLTEMSGEGIEVEVEAIAGEDGETAWSQDERQRMDDGMRHSSSAWADQQRGDEPSDGVEGDPHPEVVGLVAQGDEEFVQLEMAEGQAVEKVSVDLFGVRPGAEIALQTTLAMTG